MIKQTYPKTLRYPNSFASMILIITLLLLSLVPVNRIEEVYEVDTAASTIRWTGKKVLGEHYGTLQLEEGSFRMDGDVLQGGSFTIDMRSLENQDLEGDRREKLEDWLRSEEMFYVERYPHVRFKITSAQPLEGNERYRVEGQLTIKDISHTISFPATIRRAGEGVNVQAELKFDRTRWNLNYGSGGLVGGIGNFAIEDEVSVAVDLLANTSIQE